MLVAQRKNVQNKTRGRRRGYSIHHSVFDRSGAG
jgi:hypothetical protein